MTPDNELIFISEDDSRNSTSNASSPSPSIKSISSSTSSVSEQSLDSDAIKISVSAEPKARVWMLSRTSIRGLCDRESPLARAVCAHGSPSTTLVYSHVASNIFEMFARSLRSWITYRATDVVGDYSISEFLRLWIMGSSVKAPRLQAFALEQIHEKVKKRVSGMKNASFSTYVDNLWRKRPIGHPLREYFLDVYRTARLCTPQIMQCHGQAFHIEMLENLQNWPKGEGGVSGLNNMKLREYAEGGARDVRAAED